MKVKELLEVVNFDEIEVYLYYTGTTIEESNLLCASDDETGINKKYYECEIESINSTFDEGTRLVILIKPLKVLLGTIDASAEWQESMKYDIRQCMINESLWKAKATMMNYSDEYIARIVKEAKEIKEEASQKKLIEVNPNRNYQSK